MKRPLRTLACAAALGATALSAPALAADHHQQGAHTHGEAHATLIDRARNEIGQARFQQGPTGVLITIELDTPMESATGWHGVHLHMIGDCSNEDFTSSGGHINPSGRAHGLLNPDGPDNADLPNIYIHADGVLRAQLFTDRVSLNGEYDAPALFDDDGSALVIHDNEDDHMTQPIGGAGARHVCGVIEAVQ